MKVRVQLTDIHIKVLDNGFTAEFEYDGKVDVNKVYTDLDKLTEDIKEEVLAEYE